MKKYPKYKDSGIQWIGQIPEHWKTLKLRWICNQIFTGRTPVYSTEPNDLLVFGQRNNQKYGIDFTGIKYADEAFFASRAESEFLSFGDVLLNTLGGGSVGRIGFYDKTDMQVITDGHVMILRTNDTCTQRYLYYSLWAQQTELEEAAVGSTNQAFLTTTQMTQWRITLPPLSEQQAIVEFLDKKTGQIDQSIALLETQKTDLQAYRNRLIDEMLWNKTGEVKNICFKYITEAITVKGISHIKVGLENIESGTGKYIATESNFEGNGIAFIKGDILYGKLRPYLKKVWRADFEGAAIGDFYVYRAKSDVLHSKYLQYFLLSDSFTSLANSSTYGAKMPRVSSDFIGNILISLPPLSEQQAIADYLDKKTNEIDAALKQIDTQIADLQAYRTALISEAVTGKIDVR